MTVEWNDSGFPDHMPPDEAKDGELTGNRRFRQLYYGWLSGASQLVLQVEYSVFRKTLGTWANFWRDARPEDITPAETVID